VELVVYDPASGFRKNLFGFKKLADAQRWLAKHVRS
jgi:hypothetical protein